MHGHYSVILVAAGEAMGGVAWAGAALMLSASVITALLPPESAVGRLDRGGLGQEGAGAGRGRGGGGRGA